MDDGYASILAALIAIAGVVVLGLWEAVAILLLWGWFMVPLGVASITYWHAYGLALLVGLATSGGSVPKERDHAAFWIGKTIGPVFVIVLGGVAHALMEVPA